MKTGRGLNKKKLLAVFLSVLILALIFLMLSSGHRWPLKKAASSPELKPEEKEPDPAPFKVEEIVIPPGKTIIALLNPYGFSASRIIQLREAIKQTYDLARIPAGNKLRLLKQAEDWIGLQLELDPERYLEIDLRSEKPEATIKSHPTETRLVLVKAIIKDSLIQAVNEAGEGDLLALMLAEIFGWNIDFYLDLRKGDIFRLLVEKKYLNGQFVTYGPILAAWFINQNQSHEAYRFQFPDSGQADYFDQNGNSLRKEFLKSPLRYARITSRFSSRRLHPIRKIYRPHYGIDYAAPVGTPVQATASGVVTFAGWNGAAGRMVRIRHKNAYETMYLHLQKLAPGIKVGTRVESGQVIGYVGSSGESTGPHLDYRLLYHGKYVNPLSWKFQPAEPLPEQHRPAFFQQVQVLKNLLTYPLSFYYPH